MAEVRQRWRLFVRRGEAGRELAHRDIEALWAEGLARAGVPVAMTEGARPRPRIAFAAPVPVGLTAACEPIDLFLAERLTIADLRDRLLAALPPGHELVDLHDVWTGEPSIAGRVTAADYRAEVGGVEPAELREAVSRLLGARHLERPSRKGEAGRTYDLRALIVGLEVRPGAGPGTVSGATTTRGSGPASGAATSRGHGAVPGAAAVPGPDLLLWMRLRHHPELGTGRPEEVLAALGERLGRDVQVRAMSRERLWLAGELGAEERGTG